MTAEPRRDEAPLAGGSTSRSLLAGARGAVPAAWERLVRLYAPLVAFWCRQSGVDAQDIGDLLQEVFSAVSGHIDRFQSERAGDTFRGWLRTITRNKTHDYFRRRAIEPPGAGGSQASQRLQQIPDRSGTAESVRDPIDEPDGAPFDSLLKRALESIRGEFHERTWRAFWGVVVDGRSAVDVAADLQMKPGAVRVSKSRVLLRLRCELGDLPRASLKYDAGH